MLKERVFLNNEDHGGSAFIMWNINEDDSYPELVIGDCNKIVTLDFSLGNNNDLYDTFEKIDLLYEKVKEFRREIKKLGNKKIKKKGW